MKKRIQLTLFVDQNLSDPIEQIRKTFNPDQFYLIKSHVTLCREDELEDMEQVLRNLENLRHNSIKIEFAGPSRFSAGKGILLLAVGHIFDFQNLRKCVLNGAIEKPREHEPHITLLHPRNATCTDEIFERILETTFPRVITFHKISLIEQEMGKQWRVLEAFELSG